MMIKKEHRLAWLLILISATALLPCGCNDSSRASPRSPDALLETDPPSIDLGTIPPDGEARRSITLKNTRDRALSLTDVLTSCPCLQVSGFPTQVEPGKSAVLEIRFDPSQEPDFRGRLSIELTGKGPDNKDLFRSRADVEVAGTTKALSPTPPTNQD